MLKERKMFLVTWRLTVFALQASRESTAGDLKASADARSIARLRQQLADCKRQFRDAKMTTERELLLLKSKSFARV